jgi:NADH-quinone oxidoreductase subunit A
MEDQIWQYLPVLFLTIAAVFMVAAMLVASALLGRKNAAAPIKHTAYECGMLPIQEGVPRFAVKFYLVALLFILFDVEVVFLYPWAVVYRDFLRQDPALGLLSMLSFLGILSIGYYYALRKGAFSWRN